MKNHIFIDYISILKKILLYKKRSIAILNKRKDFDTIKTSVSKNKITGN